MEPQSAEKPAPPIPGFYVAHHRWLDAERGPDTLYKLGHTGDLRRRLSDDAYVTNFSPEWRFVYTVETPSRLDALRLEAGVLDCAAGRRIWRASGVPSELVWLTRAEVVQLASDVAACLKVPGTPRTLPPLYPPCKPAAARGTVARGTAVLTPREKAELAPLRQAFTPPEQPAPLCQAPAPFLDDLVNSLVSGFSKDAAASDSPKTAAASGASPKIAVARACAVSSKALLHRKAATDYLQEAREQLAAEREKASSETRPLLGDDALFDEIDDGRTLETLLAGFDAYQASAPRLEERAYQAEAVQACLQELGGPGRAVLQMACRCGKTRVAHGVIQDYFGRPRSAARPRVLYLVPGLALLRQTAQKLDQYGFCGSPEVLLVGSDERGVFDLKTFVFPRGCGEQAAPAGTTDAELVQAVCSQEAGKPLLVISTYQSSPLLLDVFDLAVYDECHRVCGDQRVRPFTHALLNHKRGDRLYMTATPRYDAPLSMKNRALFGGVAYVYHMRQGIDAGYVNDFSVELVARDADKDPPAAAETATAPQIVAAVDSLMGSLDGQQWPAKLVVFCRSIRHATSLRCEVDTCLSRGDGLARPPIACLAAHSRMTRAEISASLARFCTPGASAILFNCRLFQEGVEIPALNGVFFASPRHSPRDIIQSLCRPLNALPGKPPSKVFIPVSVCRGAAPDGAENLKRFASIIPYFDALVAEDPLLYEHLLDPRGTPYPLRWVDSAVRAGGEALCYDPNRLLAAARRSVRRGGDGKTERLLRAARIPWEIGFAELQRVVAECGRYPKTTDCFVYGDAKVNFGQFYRYVRDSYAEWRAGKAQPLEPHQLHALENLPGWDPYGIEGPYPWAETLAFLDRWLFEHGGVPPMVEINKGGYVGLEATPMERLSGTLTCINQSDGRDRGVLRPGSGFTLEASKQADLDRLCAKWGLQWRKERYPPPEGGVVGSLVENDKGEYVGKKTFIQEAYGRFKAEWARQSRTGEGSAYIRKWFPGYPLTHQRQERPDVWARRKEIVPPRWRGRSAAINRVYAARALVQRAGCAERA